jgi:hypothetical protein
MWLSYDSKVELDPTLCVLNKEKATSLISNALIIIREKLKEKVEKDENEIKERFISRDKEAEEAWIEFINNYVNERNGGWRKFLIFLHIVEFMTFTEAEKEKGSKAKWIDNYIYNIYDRYGDTYRWQGNSLCHDGSRLEELEKAVEKSDSINLSINDMNIISRYTKE